MDSDPLGDFGSLISPATLKQRDTEAPQITAKAEGFLHGVGTTTRETLGLGSGDAENVREMRSSNIFDYEIATFRTCRFPCDVPWHRH
jgi:hypothetical protein